MFVLRCKLPDYWRERISEGSDQRGFGRAPSRSWWHRGALVVDDAGPALIDADGLRVPIPVPSTGGMLIRLAVTLKPPRQRPNLLAPAEVPRRRPRRRQTAGRSGAAGPPPIVYLTFICGPDGQVTARLPNDEEGFDPEGMAAFAAAAGLRHEPRDMKSLKDYPGLHTSLDLRACVDDHAYRTSRAARVKRMLRIQGRRSPYEEPYRSQYPVTIPPYELPEP